MKNKGVGKFRKNFTQVEISGVIKKSSLRCVSSARQVVKIKLAMCKFRKTGCENYKLPDNAGRNF